MEYITIQTYNGNADIEYYKTLAEAQEYAVRGMRIYKLITEVA